MMIMSAVRLTAVGSLGLMQVKQLMEDLKEEQEDTLSSPLKIMTGVRMRKLILLQLPREGSMDLSPEVLAFSSLILLQMVVFFSSITRTELKLF